MQKTVRKLTSVSSNFTVIVVKLLIKMMHFKDKNYPSIKHSHETNTSRTLTNVLIIIDVVKVHTWAVYTIHLYKYNKVPSQSVIYTSM